MSFSLSGRCSKVFLGAFLFVLNNGLCADPPSYYPPSELREIASQTNNLLLSVQRQNRCFFSEFESRVTRNFSVALTPDSYDYLGYCFSKSPRTYNENLGKRFEGTFRRSAEQAARNFFTDPFVDNLRNGDLALFIEQTFSGRPEKHEIATPLNWNSSFYRPEREKTFKFHIKPFRRHPQFGLNIGKHIELWSSEENAELRFTKRLDLSENPLQDWGITAGAITPYENVRNWNVAIGLAGPLNINFLRGMGVFKLGVNEKGCRADCYLNFKW